MGWNFRKTLNLGGGYCINLSKRGIGASGGVKGFRIGLGPRGKRLQISIPGTGISYRKDEGWGTQSSGSQVFQLGRLVQLGVLGLAGAGLITWLLGLLS
jgi:hypothetical protein